MARQRVHAARALALIGFAVVPAFTFAQGIQRCEDSAGRVTYVNGACPDNARRVRDVAAEPAPSASDRQLAKERAHNDSAALKQIEKKKVADEAAAARQAQLTQAKTDKLAATCRKLELKLRAARDAVAASTLAQRTERQRQVQRVEDDYVRDCGALPR